MCPLVIRESVATERFKLRHWFFTLTSTQQQTHQIREAVRNSAAIAFSVTSPRRPAVPWRTPAFKAVVLRRDSFSALLRFDPIYRGHRPLTVPNLHLTNCSFTSCNARENNFTSSDVFTRGITALL